MTEEERLNAISEYGKFDELLSDGRIVKQTTALPVSIDIRKLLAWCKNVNRSTDTLTEQEIEQFIIQ